MLVRRLVRQERFRSDAGPLRKPRMRTVMVGMQPGQCSPSNYGAVITRRSIQAEALPPGAWPAPVSYNRLSSSFFFSVNSASLSTPLALSSPRRSRALITSPLEVEVATGASTTDSTGAGADALEGIFGENGGRLERLTVPSGVENITSVLPLAWAIPLIGWLRASSRLRVPSCSTARQPESANQA